MSFTTKVQAAESTYSKSGDKVEKTEKKNFIINIIANTFLGIAQIFATGQIMQGYLAYAGFSGGKISSYVSVSNIVQVICMAMLFFFADKIKNMKRTMQICYYIMSLFFVPLILMQFVNIDLRLMFVFLLLTTTVFNASYAVKAILDYRLPYSIIDMKNFGKMSSLGSIVAQIVVITIGFSFTLFVSVFSYDNVILVCFISGILSLFVAAFLTGRFTIINTVFKKDEKPKLSEVFREKSVFHLAPMHFLRGIVNGCFAMATVMFVANISRDVRLTAPLSVILAVGTVLSGTLYLVFIKKIRSTIYTIIGGIVTGSALIIMATTHNAWVFYPVYFIGAVGMYFIDNSIPIFIAEFVSGKIIGGYTTIRMLITTAGMATGNMLAGVFSENNVLQEGMTTVGAVAILMGFVFYIYDNRVIRKRGNQNG